MRGGNSIHKGIKRKTTTQVIQVSPDGKHERENTLTTELPSSDYACQYAKDKLTGKITCMVCGEEGHYTCDCSMKNQEKKVRKNAIRSEVPDTDKTSHATMTDKALAVVSKSTCLNCLEECHCADRIPIKKPSGELEPHDVTNGKEKLSRELKLCDITCFICHDKGHKSYSCPKKPPGELELSDVTCLKCHAKDHYTYSCPNKKPHGELEPYDDSHECQSKAVKCCPNKNVPGELVLSDVTCFKCHDKGHKSNRCPKKKSPGELDQSDFTCFNCHEKGHKSNSCPKKKSPGELELSDVTCFKSHDKGHKSCSCPKKKSPRELELSDTCFRCHDKRHYMHNCPKMKPPMMRT
ncbi:hypothetical protein SETIT_2G142000v2 [Setaria italica]|uniref:CCHC-type domain-containing protein n=1 Tax=Setaria italica TaxID=4555 RepID=A0A368PYZ7_SETIT|nr:hypothetical protein SETIT_2G142000v2 [Setaria italica]